MVVWNMVQLALSGRWLHTKFSENKPGTALPLCLWLFATVVLMSSIGGYWNEHSPLVMLVLAIVPCATFRCPPKNQPLTVATTTTSPALNTFKGNSRYPGISCCRLCRIPNSTSLTYRSSIDWSSTCVHWRCTIRLGGRQVGDDEDF